MSRNALYVLRRTLRTGSSYLTSPEVTAFYAMLRNVADENVAQMDNQTLVEKTTTFHETSGVEHHPIVGHIPSTILNPAPDVNLSNFLERPKIVGNFSWTSTMALYTNVDTTNTLKFPDIILNSADGDMVLSKMQGIYLYRPDIEITIRINTTPMHYGRLMIGVYPMPSVLPTVYTYAQNCSGGEWYQITANKNQSVSFIVPYRNTADWIDLTQANSATVRQLFQIRLYVMCPLSMSTGTATPVNVAVYARMVKPRLCGFTTATALAQMDSTSEEVVKKSEKGIVVSDGLTAISDFITCFEDIPFVGSYAKPIGYAVGKSAALLKKYGYSVPVNCATITPVTYKPILYNCCDDNPNSVKLGSAPDMSLSKDFDMVYDTPDCLNILHICQRPFLVYTGQITSTMTAPTLLFNRAIYPNNMYYDDYSGGQATTDYYCGPMTYLANYFALWRGGIRVHISFVSSSFHSCRVRAVWDPCSIVANAPSLTKGQNVFNVIMDINEQVDYSFTIPYMQDTHWLPTAPISFTPQGGLNNGSLFLQLITPLTSSSTTINPIYFQVFVSAANDFQLALPNTSEVGTFGRPLAQMDNLAQMDSIPAGTLPSCSFRTLSELNYPVIGGVERGVTSTNRNTSYAINSIKQLYSGLTPFYTVPNDQSKIMGVKDDHSKATIEIEPFGSYNFNKGTDAKGQHMFRANLFLAMRAMFMFHRGSVRVSVISDRVAGGGSVGAATALFPGGGVTQVRIDDSTFFIQSNILYDPGSATVGQLISVPTTAATATDLAVFRNPNPDNVNTGTGISFAGVMNFNQCDVTIPYFSAYNCQHLCHAVTSSFNDTPTLYMTMPVYANKTFYTQGTPATPSGGTYMIPYTVNTSATHALTAIKYAFFMAGGDDYIMGCQLPIPKMTRGSAARRRRDVVENIVEFRKQGIYQFAPSGYFREKIKGMAVETEELKHFREIIAGLRPIPEEWHEILENEKEEEES